MLHASCGMVWYTACIKCGLGSKSLPTYCEEVSELVLHVQFSLHMHFAFQAVQMPRKVLRMRAVAAVVSLAGFFPFLFLFARFFSHFLYAQHVQLSFPSVMSLLQTR